MNGKNVQLQIETEICFGKKKEKEKVTRKKIKLIATYLPISVCTV